MKYVLVIQFPENLEHDLDWLIEIENKLIDTLSDAEVDGHDIGSGEMNIFIFTNMPAKTFKVIKDILENSNSVIENAKIAYRDINSSQYFCLWPKELTKFQVR